jgi:hypothetical protein
LYLAFAGISLYLMFKKSSFASRSLTLGYIFAMLVLAMTSYIANMWTLAQIFVGATFYNVSGSTIAMIGNVSTMTQYLLSDAILVSP